MDIVEQRIVDNMGLVYHQLKNTHQTHNDDAYSMAVEGLINAAKTYDSSKKVKFATYASVCIYNGIMMYLRSKRKEQDVVIVSLDAPVPEVEDITLGDILESDEDDALDGMLKAELYKYLWVAFDKSLDMLSNPTDREVIKLWKDSDFTAKQAVIAKELGIAQPTVSRAISAFKYIIKKEMRNYLC